jgi:hypothetical protein
VAVCNFVTQKQLKVGETSFQVCTTQKLILVVALGDSQPPWLRCWLLTKAKTGKIPTKGILNG